MGSPHSKPRTAADPYASLRLKLKKLLLNAESLLEWDHDPWISGLEDIQRQAGEMKSSARIVVAGTMNHGKSSLINALLNQKDFLAVGDARTTAKNKIIPWRDGIDIIDTPGTEAGCVDEEEAHEFYNSASFILFCHSIKDGEFQKHEITILNQICNYFPEGVTRAAFIVPVFTKCEQKDEDEAEEIIEHCLTQWQEHLQVSSYDQFKTSCHRYWKGIDEDRPRFVEKSSIPQLQAWLINQTPQLVSQHKGLVLQRVNSALSSLEEMLTNELTAMDAIWNEKERNAQKVCNQIEADCQQAISDIESHKWFLDIAAKSA